MANTAYRNNVRSVNIGGWQFGFDVRTEYSNVKRSDNRITINGLRTRVRVNSDSAGYSFNGHTVQVHTDAPSGTRRRNASLGSGTFTRGSSYLGSAGNYSMNVGANATTISTRSGVSVSGGPSMGGAQNINIPALGAPANLPTPVLVDNTHNSIRINTSSKSGATWGANATSDYWYAQSRKDNSGSWVNGSKRSGSVQNKEVNFTGLTPNTLYGYRVYAMNGGGKSGTGSVATFSTLANATETSKDVQATEATFTAKVAQGAHTTSTRVQFREAGDSVWQDGDSQSGGTPTLTIEGLLPSTDYEYRYAVTTSAGTWYSSVRGLNSLPAGKLVMPDGSVVNAIPHLIHPDGTEEMVQLKVVEP